MCSVGRVCLVKWFFVCKNIWIWEPSYCIFFSDEDVSVWAWECLPCLELSQGDSQEAVTRQRGLLLIIHQRRKNRAEKILIPPKFHYFGDISKVCSPSALSVQRLIARIRISIGLYQYYLLRTILREQRTLCLFKKPSRTSAYWYICLCIMIHDTQCVLHTHKISMHWYFAYQIDVGR